MDFGLGALIGGAVSGIGSLFAQNTQFKRQKQLMEIQQQYNRENAEWEQQMAVNNWNMQNEYNTPANQIKRLEEAGLNPNLMYGNGSAATGNADNVSSANHAGVSAGQAEANNILGDAMQGALSVTNMMMQQDQMAAQIDYVKAQQRQSEAMASYIDSQKAGQDVHNLREAYGYQWDQDTRDYNFAKLVAEMHGQILGNAKTAQDTQNAKAEYDNIIRNGELLQWRLKLAPQEAVLLSRRIQDVAADIAFKMQNIEESKVRVRNIDADTFKKELEGEFDFNSFQTRLQTLTNICAESFYRSQNGKVEFDINSFESRYLRNFGSRPGTSFLNMLSSLINVGTLNLQDQYPHR